MTSDKKNISVRIDTTIAVSMRAWKMLGSMHSNVLLEYDESDFLEYSIYRTMSDPEMKGRYILEAKNLKRNKKVVIGEDHDATFAGTSLSVPPADIPKTFRISNSAYESIKVLLKESSEAGISNVVKSLLSVTMNSNREFTRFLLRNSLASRCLGTSLSFYSGKIGAEDVKNFVINGTIPRNKNTPFENDSIRRFVDFIQSIGSRNQMQLDMLNAMKLPQSEAILSSALESIMNLKEEDFLPYRRNDLYLSVVNFQQIRQYLVHLNEILHIYSTLDLLALKFFHQGIIIPIMVARFYAMGTDSRVVSNLDEVKLLLDKKFDDFRGMLNSEAESLLSLIT